MLTVKFQCYPISLNISLPPKDVDIVLDSLHHPALFEHDIEIAYTAIFNKKLL